MSAPAYSTRAVVAFALGACAGLGFAQAPKPAQAPSAAPAAPASKPADFAQPPRSADGRYGLQVLVEKVDVHSAPSPGSPIIAELQQGTRVIADARDGT